MIPIRGKPLVIATVFESDVLAIDKAIDAAERAGADMVEVRLDAAPSVGPEGIGANAKAPLLAACRAARDGGLFSGSEEERVALLARAAATGRFLLDVERGSEAERLQESIPGRIAIVSRHDIERTPRDLEGLARDLLSTLRPAQTAKLVPTARTLGEVLAIRDLLRALGEAPLASFGMGEIARASRILCGAWGSAAVWAAVPRGGPAAPGQIGLELLLHLYRFRELARTSRVFGLAGSPIASSLSPAIHNAAFEHLGLDAVYVPLACSDPADLASFARDLPLAGASITTPLKIAIVPFLRERDPSVLEAGACNTLIDGHGYNTDGDAVLAEIRSRLDPAGRPVTIVGAGGAARAAAFALARTGGRITIATRSGPRLEAARAPGRGESLARDLGARHVAIADLEADEQAILIQATSAPADEPAVPERALRAAFVLDLRYRGCGGGPEIALVAAARRLGTPAADGLGVLVHQAAAQVRLFCGRKVPIEVLFRAARSAVPDTPL